MKPHTGTTRRRRSNRRTATALALATAALLALAAAPSASALTFSSLQVTPADTKAGANSDIEIAIEFGEANDRVENLTIGLPPGLVGDPGATPPCTEAELLGAGCDPVSSVGTVSSAVNIVGLLPLTVNGDVFNMVPQPGEPARFGIVLNALPIALPGDLLLPPIKMQAGVALRPDDFGLDTIVNGLPENATLLQLGPLPPIELPIDITAMTLNLNGVAPETGKPFLRNPTSCVPATTDFTADSYEGDTEAPGSVTGSAASFTPTDCDEVPFSPDFAAAAGAAGATAPPANVPVTTAITQDVGEAGLLRADVQTPADFGANLAQLNSFCSDASFQAGTCSPAAQVGNAVAASPLLGAPLTGPVLLVASPAGIPDIGLDLKGQLAMKLKGSLALSNAVTFDGLPDIPISNFQLNFTGGPNGLLTANRDLCAGGPPVFGATFTGHNGATSTLARAATVEGCGAVKAKKCVKKKAKKKKKKKRKGKAKRSEASSSADATVAAKKKKKKKGKGCTKKRKKKKGKKKTGKKKR